MPIGVVKEITISLNSFFFLYTSAARTEQQAEAPSTDATPDATSDLLAFAKAAYKNIQRLQQDTQEETSSVTSAPVEVEAEKIESVTTETPSVIAFVVENTDNDVESTASVAEVNNEVSQTASANLSFIERAAAERQARQERLMQSAIESTPQVEADVEHTDSNNVTLKFATAPTLNQYRVVIVG